MSERIEVIVAQWGYGKAMTEQAAMALWEQLCETTKAQCASTDWHIVASRVEGDRESGAVYATIKNGQSPIPTPDEEKQQLDALYQQISEAKREHKDDLPMKLTLNKFEHLLLERQADLNKREGAN
jgi:hypothetical protein